MIPVPRHEGVMHRLVNPEKHFQDRHYKEKGEDGEKRRKYIEEYVQEDIFLVRGHKAPYDLYEFFHLLQCKTGTMSKPS